MTEREQRQCRHQIGEAERDARPPAGAALALTLVLSLALWAIGWTILAAIVSAQLQPFQ